MKPSHKRLILNRGNTDPPFTYNLRNGLKNWSESLQNVIDGEETIINLNLIGDSITEGQTDTYYAGCFTDALKPLFNNAIADVGEGVVPVWFPTTGTLRWTSTGTWADSYGIGALGRSTTDADATASLDFNGTGIVILIYKSPTVGTWSAYVDDVKVIDTQSYAGTETYSFPVTITGLDPGDHTLRIEKENTTVMILQGAYPLKGTRGVRVNRCGRASQTSTSLSAARATYPALNPFSPKLTIISITSNDYKLQTALATYKANLQTIITAAKAFGDVLLTTIGIRYYATEKAIPQSSYIDIVRGLARENGVALYDNYNAWGANATYASSTLGFFNTTTAHPTEGGYADITADLWDLIYTRMI